MAAAPVTLEAKDIQGLLASGYGRLRSAVYLMYQVTDAAAARDWLGGTLAPALTNAAAPVTTVATNVAVSASGLERLGVAQADLSTFPAEFIEGMASPHRSRMLGDVGASAPRHWRWGGRRQRVDLLLMLFALDAAGLDRHRKPLTPASGAGLSQVVELGTFDLGDHEPFGFRDGISQPAVEGLGSTTKAALPRDLVQPGEFVLGYPNEYATLPPSPSVAGSPDFGRNGSFLVFRQLHQDVAGFWNFAAREAAAAGLASPEQLAARMVGRWPGGAPLVRSPEEDTAELATFNDFAYHHVDATGLRCPIGAHVRRANPRDSLDPRPGSQQAVALVRRHRILRRGREYGPALGDPTTGPRPPLTDDGQDRGLHFICLNANLVRQFEFVQGTWVASPKFAGLYDDADPLLGVHEPVGGTFTIPGTPFRHRLQGLPRFVTVVGGEYFFLPGILGVKRLGELT